VVFFLLQFEHLSEQHFPLKLKSEKQLKPPEHFHILTNNKVLFLDHF